MCGAILHGGILSSYRLNERFRYRALTLLEEMHARGKSGSVLAKLFEGLVYNQLRRFISDNNILVEQQSGFRSQHSTETALLGSTNKRLYNMDSGLINGVLFLDLKKAFDTVDHEILLKKLHLYGIKGTSYAWFKSYIQNRKQICLMNGKNHTPEKLDVGYHKDLILASFYFSCILTTYLSV